MKRKKGKKNLYEGLNLNELFTKGIGAEINLRRSHSILIDFINEFKGDFIPENDWRFNDYKEYMIQIYEIDSCLPLTNKINLSIYDKMNEEVLDKIEKKNSEHMKRECRKIRDGKTEKQLLKMSVYKEFPVNIQVFSTDKQINYDN